MKIDSSITMYVIVRNDLAPVYKMVQGAHAIADYALLYPRRFRKWDNSTLIFLGVRNLIELNDIVRRLCVNNDIDGWASFHEPDLDRQLTALATTDPFIIKNYFQDLQLA